MSQRWVADRMQLIEMSGIRKVFDLGRSIQDPINLSIGQPHFPVPEPVRAAAVRAIEAGHNGYTVTQGLAELRQRLQADLDRRYPGQDRQLLVTSGTSGGLLLALLASVNPGDEVIVFDPYFLAYRYTLALTGGRMVPVDTYPDFRIDPDKVKAALTPRTKAILVNSPANPTGVVASAEVLKALATLAQKHGVLLISDEIYHAFCYDGPFVSPAAYNPDTLVIDGLGKTYGITGWRLGFAHGPRAVVEEMTKLQQCTYVCAPSIAQHAALAALDVDVSPLVADYHQKRDRLRAALAPYYELPEAGGAFYLFPKAPWGTGSEFCTEAVRHKLLIIPGVTFSGRDTHIRISYATSDVTLERGIEALVRIARGRPVG
jgi:aspartate/methionine/tyrosine aminotransferase